MAANQVFRVYKDEETMLKVYHRRLAIADAIFEKGKPAKERFIRRYENYANEDQVTSRGHRVNVTVGIGIIDTQFSSMTAVDVEFIARNIGHGTQEQALAAERGLNQGWRDTKGQNRSKPAIKDSLLVDIGWVKVYYDYVQDTEIRDVPDEALRAQIHELLGENPKLTQPQLSELVTATEEVDIVLRDRVCVEYVAWDCIRVDPSAKRIEDARWVAQYTQLPVDEVRFNPQWRAFVMDRYGEKKGTRLLEELEGDTTTLAGLTGEYKDLANLGWSDAEYDDERVTVAENWDFETGLVTTFPHGREDLILFQRTNPLMFNTDLEDRNPFKPLVLRDDPDSLEGLGDMRIIYPSLKELDEYRSMRATHAARAIPKVIGPADALTPKGKKALQSQEYFEYVDLDNGVSKDMIDVLAPATFPADILQVEERIQVEMKESTGTSEPMRGVFSSRRTTATEAEIVTDAGERRQAERRSALEQWYLAIARTMLQLMQVYYDRERMLRYTDDLGNEFVWSWTKEDIAIDADLSISITPKENLTREQRVQRAFMWMNLTLPLPEADRGEIIKFVGREMGFRDEDIRKMVKGDQEVEAEKQKEQAQAQLSVRPQPFGNSPAGLNITQSGGGA